MRIDSFEVVNKRSVVRAACNPVPSLMVIAGPNGAGKSTLLNELRSAPGDGHIIYISPHRTSRRQQVQARHLFQQQISIESLMAGSNMPGLEGIGLVTGVRDPWSFDDAVNYLKHGLCQIEIDRQQAITTMLDRNGQIRPGAVPDVWEPLRDLAHNLLPHLSFYGIDTSNKNEVKCLWQVHRKDIIVDLDDLSSGEKSIVQMFYPLVEHQIRGVLDGLMGVDNQPERQQVCVLIDEPELHLHPNLQTKVIDYLRLLTSDKGVQVILATHSPNMVEYSSFEELYLLRPIELVSDEENQLTQVADSEERLRFLRGTFGSTANLTAFQPVVIVEGGNQESKSKLATDRKLYRAMHQAFDQVTIIPGGGKSECLSLRKNLAEALTTFTDKLTVVALLDRDLVEAEPKEPEVNLLPVSMVENLLLDPEIIWDAIQSVIELTVLTSLKDVEVALDEILTEQEAEEISRRTISKLGARYFRPSGPSDEIIAQAAAFTAAIQMDFSEQMVRQSEDNARTQVEAIKTDKRRREFFHGKAVLDAFFTKYLHKTGLSKQVFRFELARRAKARKSVETFFETFFANLHLPDEGVN